MTHAERENFVRNELTAWQGGQSSGDYSTTKINYEKWIKEKFRSTCMSLCAFEIDKVTDNGPYNDMEIDNFTDNAPYNDIGVGKVTDNASYNDIEIGKVFLKHEIITQLQANVISYSAYMNTELYNINVLHNPT